MIFSHTGDYGDVIYSLMAVRHLAEEAGQRCRYVLYPDGETRRPMTQEHAANLLPLLEAQPYIERAEWRPKPLGVRLHFATRGRNRVWEYNLADQYTHWLHLPYSEHHPAWLTVEPNPVALVVFSRSLRYPGRSFPWPAIVQRYSKNAIFVGTAEEHRAFVRRFGTVAFHETQTLLDLARVIAGAKLFCGNQSCPRAIAEGLKVPVCVEQAAPPYCPDTHFARPDAWYDVPPPEGWRPEAGGWRQTDA